MCWHLCTEICFPVYSIVCFLIFFSFKSSAVESLDDSRQISFKTTRERAWKAENTEQCCQRSYVWVVGSLLLLYLICAIQKKLKRKKRTTFIGAISSCASLHLDILMQVQDFCCLSHLPFRAHHWSEHITHVGAGPGIHQGSWLLL